MKLKTMFVIAMCFLLSALALGQGQQQRPSTAPQENQERQVTVAGIPGVIAAGAKWTKAWQGYDNADGICAAPDGGLFFAQEQPSTVRKLDSNDYDSAFVKDTHGGASVAIDSKGRIVMAQRTCTDPGRGGQPCNEPTKISIVWPEKERKVLVDNYQGKPLGRLSEAFISKTDTIYFIDGSAFYAKPGVPAVMIGENLRAGGIMLSPDEKTFYLGNGGTIYAFDVQPDGSVKNQREFAKLQNGASGNSMGIDGAGRLYVPAGATGIQVFGPDGKYLGAIPTPRNPVIAAFAGPDKKTLYIVGGGAVAPNGKEFIPGEGIRNNGKTIYKIPMIAQGYMGRAK
jgi:gluconolactonase